MPAIRNKLFCSMSPEQEQGYTLACAERILRYNVFFVYIIIGIQIYNLIYTLVYTGWKLHTVPSRVYTVFYAALFLVSVAALVLTRYLKKNLPKRAGCTVRLQVFYSVLLMVWGTCVTVYDQRVSNSISVYLITSLTIAVVVNFTPFQAVTIYGFFLAVLYFMLPLFQKISMDNYGNNVNMTIMTLMAVFISVYRYASDRKNYLNQQIIEEQNRRLSDAAVRDSLTRLRNRRFFDEKIDSLYQQCIDTRAAMTVMMIDIDHFKIYNDTYGHQQGDECLRRMAWRLEQELDEKDEYLIRYGGEEFLYIGIGVEEKAAAEKAKQFNKVIRELVIGPSDQDLRSITISIGICSRFPKEGEPWAEHIAEADAALYAAKNSGRDRCVVADGRNKMRTV